MRDEITKEFDVFFANIKFGLVPLSIEMQEHLRELEDRIIRVEVDYSEAEEEHHWGEGFDSGFSEGYDKGKEEGFDDGHAERSQEIEDLNNEIADLNEAYKLLLKASHQ